MSISAPLPGPNPHDQWLDQVFRTNIAARRQGNPSAGPAKAPPTADPTAGLNPPPADFASFPDDLKELWAKVQTGDAHARENWISVMGTAQSAQHNAATHGARLAAVKAEVDANKKAGKLESGIIAAIGTVSPLAGAALHEIGGFETVKELVGTDWGKEWNDTALAIGGQVQKRVDGLAEALVAAPDAVKSAAQKLQTGIDALADVLVALPDQAKAAASSLKDAASGWDMAQAKAAIGALKGQLTDLAAELERSAGKGAGELAAKATRMLDSAAEALGAVADDPMGALQRVGKSLSDGMAAAGDALSRADKAFWRADPTKVREKAADFTVEAASQAAQAVAFEGVAKVAGAGLKAVRGGAALTETAEVARDAETALGSAKTAVKGGEAAADGMGALDETKILDQGGFCAKPQPVPDQGFGMKPEPAPDGGFGANPEPPTTAHQAPPAMSDPGVAPAEKQVWKLSDGKELDLSEEPHADVPAEPDLPHTLPKMRLVSEGEVKMVGAEREVETLASVAEKVPGGKDAAVEAVYQRYSEGAAKLREGLSDPAIRAQLGPDELARLEAAVEPGKMRSLDDFRRSAGLDSAASEATPTVRLAPGEAGQPGVGATRKFEQPDFDQTQKLDELDFGHSGAGGAAADAGGKTTIIEPAPPKPPTGGPPPVSDGPVGAGRGPEPFAGEAEEDAGLPTEHPRMRHVIEGEVKMLGAENDLRSIAGAVETVSGGKSEAVAEAYQRYREGAQKIRAGLADPEIRAQLTPAELERFEAATRPDRMKSLDEFRASAGLDPTGSETAPTVRIKPAHDG